MYGRAVRYVMGAVVLVAAVASFGACGEPGDEPSVKTDAGLSSGNGEIPETVSFSTHVQPIFTRRCVSCHSTALASGNGNLDLEEGKAYAALVDVDANCGALKRVEPGDSEMSAIWLKSAGEPGCGAEMPTGTPLKTLAPKEFKIIERWIEQGAPNN